MEARRGCGPAGGEHDGLGPGASQNHQGSRQVVAAVTARRRIVGCHLGEPGNLCWRPGEQRHTGERAA